MFVKYYIYYSNTICEMYVLTRDCLTVAPVQWSLSLLD